MCVRWAFQELQDQVCTVRRLMQNARSHSSVFIRSIQVCECAFALRQEQKRDHFGTVAVDAHRMLHHDSTVLTTRASGPGWNSAGLPHIQGVHRNLRTNLVDPRSPLQKLIHTINLLTNIFVLQALGWCFPDISEVGRSSLLLAERSSFSLISCFT